MPVFFNSTDRVFLSPGYEIISPIYANSIGLILYGASSTSVPREKFNISKIGKYVGKLQIQGVAAKIVDIVKSFLPWKKPQKTNYKSQINLSLQCSNFKILEFGIWILIFGIYLLFGTWYLIFYLFPSCHLLQWCSIVCVAKNYAY